MIEIMSIESDPYSTVQVHGNYRDAFSFLRVSSEVTEALSAGTAT
jgi:hypothetical protein